MANEGSASNSRLLVVGALVLVIGVVLVLLIVRGNIGDDEPVASESTPTAPDDDPATEPAAAQTPLTNDQVLAGRLQLPLEIPEGHEAVTVRATYIRSVAGIPGPGDLVNLYRLPPDATQAEGQQAEQEEAPAQTTQLPPAGPDAELFLTDIEVLGVTGATPGATDGPVNFVLAMQPADVPGLMALANTNELWVTLLPSSDEPTGTAGDQATEGDA